MVYITQDVNNLMIHKAHSNDIDSIEVLYNESIEWLDSQGIHQWKKGVYPVRETAINALRDGNLYCCKVNCNILGTFIINEDQAPQYKILNWRYGGKVLVVHTLVIRPTATGQGLGKTLMKFIISYAQTNGYEAIRLDAFPDNKAAAGLYASFGFEYVGKVFFEYKEPGFELYDCYEKFISAGV